MKVNDDMDTLETETEVCLFLAKLYDEGFPLIPHVHDETSSTLRAPTHDISEKHDSTPEECATNDAPVWEENRQIEKHA